ncbi:MAG: lipocalin-like domain-containing protein [Pseudomonadota bacterium]
MRKLSQVALSLILLLNFYGTALGQNDMMNRFVGSWFLHKIEVIGENGEWRLARGSLGESPIGILTYDDKGNMTAQLVHADRYDIDLGKTNDEVVGGYVAYYGTYEIDEESETVTHHRTAHINPVFGDLSVVRYYQFESDKLSLTVAPERNVRLIWRKAP